MAKPALILAALAVCAAATAARAADAPPVGQGPACDFFEAQLIGVLCGHTAYVAPGVLGGDETIKSTTSVSPAGAGGPGTLTQHWDYRNLYESMTLAVSPWQGVRFHVTGEAFQYDNSYWSQFTPNGGGASTTTNLSASGSLGGWQGIGAEVTLWDTHFGTPFGNVHYVFSAVGGLQFFPGGGPYPGRDLLQIGWQSGAELPLGGTGFSLDYFATNLLRRFDNPGIVDLDNTTRLLLSNNAWGVAIGPRIEGATVLWHSPGYNTGWSAFGLGGEALVEPFRHTSIPVLRDLTLDLSATHSIGQAGLVPEWAGSASGYIYAAEARFNFSF